MKNMAILIGIGANLAGTGFAMPLETCQAALRELAARDVVVARRSRWYESAPVPPSGQPWFVNAVAALETALPPKRLLALVHRLEAQFGRRRDDESLGGPGIGTDASEPLRAARPLDLDLLDYRGLVIDSEGLALPHPRLHRRAFVLLPLAEIVPDWHHPVTGESVSELIAALPADQVARPLS